MPRNNKNQALDKIKKDISLEEKLRNVPTGMLRYQWEDTDRERVGTSSREKQKFTHTTGKKDKSPMTSEFGEIIEKLKDKKVEYKAIASSDSSVNLEDIDNKTVTKVLGPERYDRV
ncbi:hypothetical protein F383_33599 [Gossypium arboreum]|uniref:Uncharacterized protein n=1 Tax=Gossypium arboreum TaxID=29729 RepID=A0A0B0MXA8_GOSAR|nr:hypothetical protein F383_33599 [Gossypium arboreum]